MYMHINKTGNNETIIKIINTYALTGDDTGLIRVTMPSRTSTSAETKTP